MKLDFKSDLGGGNVFQVKNLGHHIAKTWNRIHMVVFFALLVLFAAFGWSIWNGSIMGSVWSDQKKQEFLNAQNTGVTFKEKEFNKVVESVKARNEEYVSPYQPINDFFKPYN